MLCLYLAHPALHAVHLEGFTAQTQSIALLKARAPLLEHDTYLPAVTQFIAQSRSAVIALLSGIYLVSPGAGDTAYQCLIWASLLTVVAGSLWLARRWGGAPALFGFIALMLTPGVIESSFFFNDNIVSAALAIAALLPLHKRSCSWHWVVSGALLGAAILARIDAVLMAPVLVGLVLMLTAPRRGVAALALMSLGCAAVLAAAALWLGFSVLDALITSRQFVVSFPATRWISARLFFFGLITPPLIVVGARSFGRALPAGRRIAAVFTLIVYPLLLALVAPKATEARYIFPLLAPFVALHAGLGLRIVHAACTGTRNGGAWAAWAWVAWATMVLCAPTTMLLVHDGPRSVLGRLWSPPLWRQWQSSVDTSSAREAELAQTLARQTRSLVISTHFNDEFFIRLRLFEIGFDPEPIDIALPGCRGFSVYRRGKSLVFHVRTEAQYGLGQLSIARNAALQIKSALECSMLMPLDVVTVTTFGLNEYGIDPALYGFAPGSFAPPLEIHFPDALLGSRYRDKLKLGYGYGLFAFKPIPVTALQELANRAAALGRKPADGNEPLPDDAIQTYNDRYKARPGPTQPLIHQFKRWVSAW